MKIFPRNKKREGEGDDLMVLIFFFKIKEMY